MPQVHFFKTSVITCYPHFFIFQSPGQIIEIDRHECFRETMRRRSSAISSACHAVTMEKTHGYFGDRKWWNMMAQYGSNHGEWIDLGIKTIKTHGKSNFQSSDFGRVEQILPGFSFGTSWKSPPQNLRGVTLHDAKKQQFSHDWVRIHSWYMWTPLHIG